MPSSFYPAAPRRRTLMQQSSSVVVRFTVTVESGGGVAAASAASVSSVLSVLHTSADFDASLGSFYAAAGLAAPRVLALVSVPVTTTATLYPPPPPMPPPQPPAVAASQAGTLVVVVAAAAGGGALLACLFCAGLLLLRRRRRRAAADAVWQSTATPVGPPIYYTPPALGRLEPFGPHAGAPAPPVLGVPVPAPRMSRLTALHLVAG